MESEEDFSDQNYLNDPESLLTEINFDAEPKKLPEVNETARFFEKETLQKRYYRKCVEEGKKEELETLDAINVLKLNMNYPLFGHMFFKKETFDNFEP